MAGTDPISPAQADDRRELLQQLVASIEDYAIFLLDAEGNVATWNLGAQRLKGYTQDEIVGRHFSAFFLEEDVRDGKPERELAEATASGRAEDESWRLRKDGTRFWANVVIIAIRDESGELRGFGKVTRDLTERVMRERALQESRDQLQRSNADLEQFAFAASHDLQQPLRQVAGFTQLLQRRYAEGLDPAAREYLDRVVSGTDRMQALIRDLLAFARLGRSEEPHAPVELGPIVAQAVEDLGETISETGATLEVAALPSVLGDAHLLVLVFQNLIANAIKFHRLGVPPTVTIGAERAGGAQRIAITDDGIGIDAEQAERIFGIFERLVSHDQVAGTGIGLAMCRKIVESHGGTIALDTGAGLAHGSRFVVELPAT